MKQYQSWLGQYLMSRRDGDHAMASELANSICEFWQARGDEADPLQSVATISPSCSVCAKMALVF